jgi:hypothetical protein
MYEGDCHQLSREMLAPDLASVGQRSVFCTLHVDTDNTLDKYWLQVL